MRTFKFYLYELKFNNASLLSVYFITTEGVGSHYEGHKYFTDELKNIASICFQFYKSSVVLHYLLKITSKTGITTCVQIVTLSLKVKCYFNR